MNDEDRRIICFRYLGTVFVYIEVIEGFYIFKNFAENFEIENYGAIYIVDEDPYYFIDFTDPKYVDTFIDALSNA